MNVNVIGVVGYHAMYVIRSIDGSVAGNRFADEISKAAARLETVEPDSGKAIPLVLCNRQHARAAHASIHHGSRSAADRVRSGMLRPCVAMLGHRRNV